MSYVEQLGEAWKLHLADREIDAPTVISTFAGCGGSSLGYSMAGFRELLAAEWDDNAVAVFKLNLPDVPIYHGDIAKLTAERVLELTGLEKGQLDVLDGSPPCQGFSTSGKRKFDDSRNSLFMEFARLLRGLQPKTFVMENVSGMVKGVMKFIFVKVLKELKACGYQVRARLLNAKHYGVPQNRERVIFVGVRNDFGMDVSHPKGNLKILTMRDALAGLSETEQDEAADHVWKVPAEKWIKLINKTKMGSRLVPKAFVIRPYWDKPSPTQQHGLGNVPAPRTSLLHPSQSRTLSIREMARCQSFPDEFRFINALMSGQSRIGNSVPPLFMRALANHVRGLLTNAGAVID